MIVDVHWEGEDFASQGCQNFVKIGEDPLLFLRLLAIAVVVSWREVVGHLPLEDGVSKKLPDF